MVIYEREKKTLIIPTGLGNINYGGDSYEQGVSDGKAEQAAADRAKLTTKNITENGSYEAPYGFSQVNVNVPTSGGGDCSEAVSTAYASGITEGMREQRNLMETKNITSNGHYTRYDGWNEINVNVPTSGGGDCSEAIATAYESGHTAGVQETKAGMVSTAITANGHYTRYDGWNEINVNVPTSGGGGGCNLEAGVVNLIADGPTWITYPLEGYDGFRKVTINDMGYGQGKYNEGYSDGYANGYVNSRNDMTEITPASSVTLTEYGTYYFTYDENTDLESMLVNFAHTQPQPPHSGSTSGYGGFVRIQSFGRKDLNDFPLYNENADDSTLSGIQINGEEFTGGSRYTGSASQITYYFEGQIPDDFWSGWSVDGMGFYAEMHFESMLIGKNAFKNANIDRATIFTNKECIIDEGAFENTTIWSMHLMQYKSGGTFTFNHNSFKDNYAFRRLRTYMRSMVINGDSSLFANSKRKGTAQIDSRVPLNDIYATQWWSTLENQRWTAENN